MNSNQANREGGADANNAVSGREAEAAASQPIGEIEISTDESNNVAAAEQPPKKRPPGRPKGSKTTKHTNLTPIVDDPSSDLRDLDCSDDYIRLLNKKKLPELAEAYTALQNKKATVDGAQRYIDDKIAEIDKLKSMLDTAHQELQTGENQLAEQRASLQETYQVVSELELRRKPCSWNEWYEKLVAYKEQHGDVDLPARWKDNNELDGLCMWLTRQKKQYKNFQYGHKNERPWRVAALQKLGVKWEKRASLWDTHYKELLAYKERHGDCIVPTKAAEYKDLGVWVAVQRNEYLKRGRGEPTQLNQKRIDRLNEVGFVWNVTNHQWNEMYKKLVECVEAGRSYEDDKELSLWMDRQKREYVKMQEGEDHERDSLGRLRSSRMIEERVQLLKDIGFDFSSCL